MWTCSIVAAATTFSGHHSSYLKGAGQRILPPLLYPSSKSNLLSLKQCVHKLMTQQQQPCFFSSLSSSSSPSSINLPSLQTQHHANFGRKRSRHHSYYYHRRCLLNLNHHISFHYINNSSTVKVCHHHYFHQSAFAAVAGSDKVAAASKPNGSITANTNVRHDIVNNDSQHRELHPSVEDEEYFDNNNKNEGDDIRMLYKEDDDDGWEEGEEERKEQVWSVGPTLLPTFNVGAYANESENVKRLVQLGVDLSQWEPKFGTIPLLYKANFEKTMQPIISLLQETGVNGEDLSRILTENPYIFNETLQNLEKRLEYLRAKQFSEDIIVNAIVKNPYWLSYSVPRIDRRLGFYQTYFGLTGDQVRKLVKAGTSGPKLITYHLGHVKDVTFTIKEEMGFTSEEIVKLLLTRPRIWKEAPFALRRRFDYLHNEENFSHDEFINNPWLLLYRERRMRERIGFLKMVGRAQFDPQLPNFVTTEKLCMGVDSEFATSVAGVSVEKFNNYLKTL